MGAEELIKKVGDMSKKYILSSSVFLGVIINMVSRTNLSADIIEIFENSFGEDDILQPMLPSREAFRTILDTNEKFVDDMIGELTANIMKKIKKCEA